MIITMYLGKTLFNWWQEKNGKPYLNININ